MKQIHFVLVDTDAQALINGLAELPIKSGLGPLQYNLRDQYLRQINPPAEPAAPPADAAPSVPADPSV